MKDSEKLQDGSSILNEKEVEFKNLKSLRISFILLTIQFLIVTVCFMYFGATATGECSSDSVTSCVLT